jgi:hypothetical protein
VCASGTALPVALATTPSRIDAELELEEARADAATDGTGNEDSEANEATA